MEHIKLYRNKFTQKELKRFMSNARSKAKHKLSNKHKKEYRVLVKREYQKIKRKAYFKKIKEVLNE